MSMEIRMLLAIVLSFLIFFVFQSIFGTPTGTPPETPVAEEAGDLPDSQTAEPQVKPLAETALPSQAPGKAPLGPDRTITVETQLYIAEISEQSGCFSSFKLKGYGETLGPEAPRKELIRLPVEQACTPVVAFSPNPGSQRPPRGFRTPFTGDLLDVSTAGRSLTFSSRTQAGVSITKTYRFDPNSYEIDLQVTTGNLTDGYREERLSVSLNSASGKADRSRYVFSGPAALIDNQLKEVDVDDIEDEPLLSGKIDWVAVEDQYFVAAVIPETPNDESTLRLAVSSGNVLSASYVDPSGPLPPKSERTLGFKLYFGPKDLDALNRTGTKLSRIVDFGFFDIIAKPLLHAMKFIHRYIPNYGVAIIMITIVVKLLFWPLSNRSYKSMSQMKRLQPKMAEIRAKYKDDKRMMNQELMNLYKIYKVNPLGGCLPMVLQIPVFFAFYKMLYQAIELRHAPFLWWINDLSAPDRLLRFNVEIPLMAPPYGIPVLTVIMGASMFFQQKMSPPPGDPTQAKMMMFMPIFFTFIFINFPSGLVLYWLVNNILSMAQQYYITKKTA